MARRRTRAFGGHRAPTSSPRRSNWYGIEVLKLDNPGAGTHYFLAEGGQTLVESPDQAARMSQLDAKSLLLSTPIHQLVLSLDGVLETQVMKFH